MSIIDQKNFAGGGMDTDSAPELVAPNDYREAYNLRNTGNSENESGYLVSIESNDAIALSLPVGLNKCIGSRQFENVRKIYKFIFNSNNYHTITEIDYDTETETILFTNRTDSGGENVLILTADVYVTDIKLLENLLIFRNSLNEPCLINIDRLKSGGYGVLTKDDFMLIRQQPLTRPTAVYGNDLSFSSNFLRAKLFQFRTQFIYDDNETSVWGAMSDRPVPVDESNPNVGTVAYNNNAIVVAVNIGGDRVKELNIATRQGNYDWAIAKTVTREYILALPTNSLVVDLTAGVYEGYDPTTNIYSFVFYNNGLYPSVDVLETDLLCDYIPKECDSLEVINGRGDINSNGTVLTLGAGTEGYPRPNTSISLSSSAVSSGLTYTNYLVTDPLRIDPSRTGYRKFSNGLFDVDQRRDCWIAYKGIPKLNDVINVFVTEGNDKNAIRVNASYTVESGDLVGTNYQKLTNVIRKIQEVVANQGVGYVGSSFVATTGQGTGGGGTCPADTVMLVIKTVDNDDGRWFVSNNRPNTIELASIGTGAIKSIPSIKSNSSYQLGLAYYDKYGRPFPLQSDSTTSIQTNSYAENKGFVSFINWNINSAPPAGAETYQWVSSRNTTHATSLYVNGIYKTGGDQGSYIEINLNTLNKYQTNNPNTNVGYSFTPNDRITFNYYIDEIESVLTNIWFDGIQNPQVDLEILDYDIVVTTVDSVQVTNYILKVQNPSGIDLAELENKVLYMELYTPLNSASQLDNIIFYEVGEKYPIVNGEHSVTHGQIGAIDCYFKTREYNIPNPYDADNLNGVYTFLAEDFNFSDFYLSNYTSLGRPRTFYDTPEDVKYPATIRYSYEYISRSKTNLINRFYGENLVTYDLKYGAIKKMLQRDNTLICVQETKVGYVPVSISIIEDQASQNNVATSTLLLNKIRYSDSGSIGIGNAVESFTEYNGVCYFVDPNRSEPIQISYNGVSPISGKMSKFFKRTLKNAVEDGVKLIGYYNIFNKEYILTTEQPSGVIVQIAFDAQDWDDQEAYEVNKSTLVIETAPTKGSGTLNTTTGIYSYTPDLGETGSDSFTFSFTPVGGGATIEKNVCLTITEGTDDIPYFSLNEVVGQNLDEYSEQSVQVGPFQNTGPVAISIASGGAYSSQYKINDGSWTSSAGYFNPGDYVVVRVFTSPLGVDTTNATLTIGDKSSTFYATTALYDESGYFILDIFDGNASDTYAASISYLDPNVPSVISESLIYTGNNEYPVVLDPEDTYLITSNFADFGAQEGWRFIFNFERFKVDYPDTETITFTVGGKRSGAGGSTNIAYSSKSPDATLSVVGGSEAIPTVTGGYTVLAYTTTTANVAGSADGNFEDLPPVLYVTYTYSTNAINITYPV
jgi:hypothetical protein